jgi:AraC family transcriptional regulator
VADLPDLANLDYLDRINRAMDHVRRNLADPLNLEDVAHAAAFSPFHFHRIFKAIAGETLHAFVKRTRLERALFLMARGEPASLTDIALSCGFGSSSDFSRSFKGHFGVAPRDFDMDTWRKAQREALTRATPGLEGVSVASSDCFEVTLRDLPARRVAYLRVTRPFEPGRVPAACKRFVAWATEHGLERGAWLGYQWESPEFVPLELCRYDVGLEVPAGVPLGPELGEAQFGPMKVAEVPIRGGLDLELRAFDWLYGQWLPKSGWVPDHQPAFEAWDGEPYAYGETHFELRIQLAVRKPGPG